MFDLIKGPDFSGKIVRRLRSIGLALALGVTSAGLTGIALPSAAKADSFYVGTGGVGFAFGTRGYRGGVFYGGYRGGYAGPPFRPYGPPYYYHPYDRRAYPYRSRVYVAPRRYVRPPLYIAPRGRYVAPRGGYVGQPQRVPYTKTGIAPFTPQWVAYCSRKFKSFNPNTGTYLAYSGKYRFCR
ncbi:BA14K family protein [uncultured Roseibium sp.]|uniref:BA14K family protein n=1 Tax=uncultured Roseibium sp. TaxID=1936171 RepID=UPI0026104F54|nr:BA14K family protein [uncultured Roseibium sp.]